MIPLGRSPVPSGNFSQSFKRFRKAIQCYASCTAESRSVANEFNKIDQFEKEQDLGGG